ncbi:Smc1a, partial [Symbiodinium sp. KB8]
MGRIDHLEVEDFKSYAGKQVIGPFRGFTAVIGPNGAGKSNLMDAISFVLGLQARHLRGNTLKDLVFKVEGATGGPSSASVKLVYVVEDGEVAGKAAGTELVFTRLITPAGVSTYKLDDKEVTHAAYDATLKSIGVLTKARNFLVFQGDVQNMGNMTPDRMLQHLAQCAALHEEYTFKRSQRQSVKTEKAALEADKAEAEAYLAAQEQLAHLRLQSFLWQLFHIEGDLSKGAGHIAGLGEELSEAEADEAAAAQEVKAGQAQYAASKRRRTAAERSMADLTKAVDKHSTRASEAQNAVVRCGKAVVAQQERLEAAQRDAEAVRGTIAEVEGELSKLAEQITALEGGGGEATGGGGLALTAKQLPEYTKLKAVARQRTVEHRQSVESLEREQAGDKDTLADLSSRVSAFQDRITAAEKDVASSREKIEKYRATQTAESAGIAQATEHVRKLEAELQSDVARQEALASELGEVQAALHEARDVRRSSNEEKAAATALADMKRLYPGVRGRLVDLVAPAQGRFATAVDVALGRLGDAIVVDTGDVAAECIQYLRSHQVRACSFLALDTIRPPEPSPRLAHLSGPFRLATDVIVCEDAPSLPALEFVVGNVVVADSLADATLLRFQRRVVCKVVTLDGSIVAKNGHMTGGVSAKGGGRRRFDEKALAALKSKRDALLSEEEALRRRTGSGPASRGRSKLGRTIESVKNTVKVGQNKLRAISDAMTRMEARVAQRTQELTNIRSELGELTPKVEALTAAVAARQERLDTLHSQVHSAEDEVFADFCAKHGLGSIREYETTVVAAAAARSQELEGLQDAHSKLVSKRDFEASRLADLQRLMTAAETGVLKAKAAEVDAKRALETANADVETARQSLGSALDELEDTQAAFDAAEGAMKAAKRKREVARKAAQDVQKRIAAHDALMEKRRAARHDLLVRARVAQVSIPRVPGAGGGDSADTPAS